MKLWVTVSGYAFDDDRLRAMLRFEPDAVRINLGREHPEWAQSTIALLEAEGFPPSRVYLDVGNSKPRIQLGHRAATILCSPTSVLTLFRPTDELFSEASVSHPVMSNFADLEQGDSLVVGDGVAELLVTCAGRDRVSLVAERSIEIPDGTSLFVKGGRQARAGVRDLERESVNDLLSRWPASLLISFVESATAVSIARDMFPKAFEVVPKVETFHGVRNVAEIASVSDTIMLGRGDLALSVGLGRLGAAQEEVMREAHSAGSNVVIATGVLESLMGAEIPTRAEAIDLYKSYRQGAYGVALTSETAGARQDPIRVIRGARALMDDMEGKIAHSRAERHGPGPTL